eukprot:scaffold77158_cov18-Phaeocystis_antarctica.AAC.1
MVKTAHSAPPKPRVTTLPLVSGQVAGGIQRRSRKATLASPRPFTYDPRVIPHAQYAPRWL